MFKTAFLILVALVLAIGGGGASVWYALKAQEGVGAVTVDGWTAFPDMGTPEADPYSKARVAREGSLALGRAEGLAFNAQRDSSGERLRRECGYRIEGSMPSTRFWTLHAVDAQGALIRAGFDRAPALQSLSLLRADGGGIVIAAAAQPAPGNWLPLSGKGDMSFVLTLYDTPIAASTGLSDIRLPRIVRMACHA
ncbi:MAG: DUF1214 domain-containing protein [Rhizobiaceae bacterium]